jgi:hypothetical protein
MIKKIKMNLAAFDGGNTKMSFFIHKYKIIWQEQFLILRIFLTISVKNQKSTKSY